MVLRFLCSYLVKVILNFKGIYVNLFLGIMVILLKDCLVCCV